MYKLLVYNTSAIFPLTFLNFLFEFNRNGWDSFAKIERLVFSTARPTRRTAEGKKIQYPFVIEIFALIRVTSQVNKRTTWFYLKDSSIEFVIFFFALSFYSPCGENYSFVIHNRIIEYCFFFL